MESGEPGRIDPLGIPELLGQVFSQLRDDPRTLARCARVSKAWSERALETLWAGPVWCSSLLTVLPEKTASATPFGLSRASQSESSLRNQRFILSVPTPQEIDRLNYYAGMIEHLRFDESDAAHPWLSVQLKFPKLKIIEAQPVLDLETVLTFAPLCGPNVTRVLLDLDEENDPEDSEDEDAEDGPDPVWGDADQYDTASSFAIITYVASHCPNLTELSICLGQKTSSSIFSLLAPLKGTLKRLSLHIPNEFDGFRQRALKEDSLRLLDGFEALEFLELRVQDFAPGLDQTPFNLPSLKEVILMDLWTEHAAHVLPLLPSTITSLSLFSPLVSSKSDTHDWTKLLCDTLGRFTDLETLQVAGDPEIGPQEDGEVLGSDLQKSVIDLVCSGVFHKLERFASIFAYTELPPDALTRVARSVPTLRHLQLLTRDMSDKVLEELAKALPELESLAVHPYIKIGKKLGAWSFHKMQRFGEITTELSQGYHHTENRRRLRDVVEEDPEFVSRFTEATVFGASHPLMDHLEFHPVEVFHLDQDGDNQEFHEDGDDGESATDESSTDSGEEGPSGDDDGFETVSDDEGFEDGSGPDDVTDSNNESTDDDPPPPLPSAPSTTLPSASPPSVASAADTAGPSSSSSAPPPLQPMPEPVASDYTTEDEYNTAY